MFLFLLCWATGGRQSGGRYSLCRRRHRSDHDGVLSVPSSSSIHDKVISPKSVPSSILENHSMSRFMRRSTFSCSSSPQKTSNIFNGRGHARQVPNPRYRYAWSGMHRPWQRACAFYGLIQMERAFLYVAAGFQMNEIQSRFEACACIVASIPGDLINADFLYFINQTPNQSAAWVVDEEGHSRILG